MCFLFILCVCLSANAVKDSIPKKPPKRTETAVTVVQITSAPSGAKIEIASIYDKSVTSKEIIGKTPLKIVVTKIDKITYELINSEWFPMGRYKWKINKKEFNDGFIITVIPPQKKYFIQTKEFSGNITLPKKINFDLSIPPKKELDK